MSVRTKDKVSLDVVKATQAASSLVAALSSDDEALRHDMVEGETDLFEAIEAALSEIDECDVIAAGCKEKEAQFAERRRGREARAERLRGLIEQALLVADLPSVKLTGATITVKSTPPKPIYEDEAAIPSEFWRQSDPVLDKKKIAEAVKDGREIPGVTMTNGSTSLQIRRT